jgi:hypothetical protein
MAVRKRKKKKVWQSRADRTMQVRDLLLKEAKREGVISNERACEVGGLQQSWYHLNALVEARKLKRAGYNQWMPVRR